MASARCASAPTPSQPTPSGHSSRALSVDSSGALRPGDIVRLRIWREPDLSGEFGVDEQGTAVFPKIGPRRVLGLQPDTLRAQLVRSYSLYLRNPAIEVTLLRRITILGGVRNPGLHPVDPTMTLADAFALAGGVTPEAKPDEVELVRNGQRTRFKISQETRITDTPVRSGDQLYVPTKGWLARNTWLLSAGIGATFSLILALAR
jgi:protein involved in polysaccharide export with SLBB domain